MQSEALRYEIVLAEPPAPHWNAWFEGLHIQPGSAPPGSALLSGPMADQAALFGVLARIRNLNLTLISLRRLPPE